MDHAPQPQPGSKRGQLILGILLIAGVVVTSGLRLAGVRPAPATNTGVSQGSDIGWWIGSAVGLAIGVALVLAALRSKKV